VRGDTEDTARKAFTVTRAEVVCGIARAVPGVPGKNDSGVEESVMGLLGIILIAAVVIAIAGIAWWDQYRREHSHD